MITRNPNGGAIASAIHCASGARIALSTARELQRTGGKLQWLAYDGIGGLAMDRARLILKAHTPND